MPLVTRIDESEPYLMDLLLRQGGNCDIQLTRFLASDILHFVRWGVAACTPFSRRMDNRQDRAVASQQRLSVAIRLQRDHRNLSCWWSFSMPRLA